MVYSDDVQGGQEMTKYLLSLGHRDIWFVGNVRLPWFARHYEGYQPRHDCGRVASAAERAGVRR